MYSIRVPDETFGDLTEKNYIVNKRFGLTSAFVFLLQINLKNMVDISKTMWCIYHKRYKYITKKYKYITWRVTIMKKEKKVYSLITKEVLNIVTSLLLVVVIILKLINPQNAIL